MKTRLIAAAKKFRDFFLKVFKKIRIFFFELRRRLGFFASVVARDWLSIGILLRRLVELHRVYSNVPGVDVRTPCI